MIAWRIERWRPARVRALEVWDLPYRGGLLYQRLGTPALERGLEPERVDLELAAALAHLVTMTAPVNPVFVVGGLAARSGMQRALEFAELEQVHFGREPVFYGEASAREALLARADEPGLLVDVGQTALKATDLATGARRILERPLDKLPRYLNERAAPPAHVEMEQAARLAVLVSAVIAEAAQAREALAPSLVLALPCTLDGDGTPGPCTYAGWVGDVSWVPRMLARVEALLPTRHPWCTREVSVLLVHDAELAAAAAALELGPQESQVLAVTLGFGPGAAWLFP